MRERDFVISRSSVRIRLPAHLDFGVLISDCGLSQAAAVSPTRRLMPMTRKIRSRFCRYPGEPRSRGAGDLEYCQTA
ncbi:MAG: hypothetical protein DME20_03845 [Verrucomicrobia bacterium]|nr:MAG: hypothetical protein DME92_07205 [Verrucomicrobiota bacterium]PYJ63599.1 MAG: hypothetical protein DME74_02720 [Verrucomicrobiota bacterium]PYK50553.1 MAG: hypothetical protein DME20_03845 [Verrucomicrobiota bacterium]